MSYEQCAARSRARSRSASTRSCRCRSRAARNRPRVTPPYVLSDAVRRAERAPAGICPTSPTAGASRPEQMPQLPPAPQTGRLRVLNISQHFFSGQAPINDAVRPQRLQALRGARRRRRLRHVPDREVLRTRAAHRHVPRPARADDDLRAGEADVPVDRDEPDDRRVPDACRSRRRSSTRRRGSRSPAVRAASATSRTAGRATSGIAGTSIPGVEQQIADDGRARAAARARALRRQLRRRRRAVGRHRRREQPRR